MSASHGARRSRSIPSRPARVIVIAALGLGLAGGATGAMLGGVGSVVSSEAAVEHGEHATVRGIEEHQHGSRGDGDDLPAPIPVPVPAPAAPAPAPAGR